MFSEAWDCNSLGQTRIATNKIANKIKTENHLSVCINTLLGYYFVLRYTSEFKKVSNTEKTWHQSKIEK